MCAIEYWVQCAHERLITISAKFLGYKKRIFSLFCYDMVGMACSVHFLYWRRRRMIGHQASSQDISQTLLSSASLLNHDV